MHGRTRWDAVDELQVEALLLGGQAAAPERFCRICFDSAVAPGDRLLAPCRCRGTMKYVHASCLDEWRAKSRRADSARKCEQCGAAYMLRATLTMRLLASRAVRVVLSLSSCLVLAQCLGVLARIFLQSKEPALFEAMHPWAMQSVSYEPSADAKPWTLPPAEREPDALSLLWDQVLGPMDDPEPQDSDLYVLGIFQPVVLLQAVQGMLQRSLEMLAHARLARPTQRVVTVHGWPGGTAGSPAAVSWTCARLYELTLGLAFEGLVTNIHTVSFMSSLSVVFAGLPFAAVAMYEMGGSVAVVWESDHWLAPLLLAIVLWGVARMLMMVLDQLSFLGHYVMAHTPHLVADYGEVGAAPIPPRAAARPSWAQWTLQRMLRGHAAMRDLHDPRFVWMLAQAGD
ncbi:hypothetical protein MCAP1_003452 [Malassezia caprae]|uniref:RING-CH-type domain-containing protein n=1 Tax=Malassezia caprae TaxID=1381934 RepID=A0AAF0EAS7_9BASI|nr:hypothetical protein MCAP1_003452 [Malassezia caprae]